MPSFTSVCSVCAEETDLAVTLRDRGENGERICASCSSDDRFLNCYHCNHLYDAWNTDCCVPELDGDEEENGAYQGCECRRCVRARVNSNRIHNYSYRPAPVFHGEKVLKVGQYGREYDGALYMGFELEMCASGGDVVPRLLAAMNGPGNREDTVYLKSDSSISGFGFEMVTHPATLDHYMTGFNWRGLRDLRRSGDIRPDDSCGMHVHVSKDGFSGPAHEYRWLMLWYRNQHVMKRLARRDTRWANFATGARPVFGQEVRGKVRGATEHYDAINRGNDNTYEVRVFASTLYVNRLKANLQLVEGTVEYTRSALLTGKGKKVDEAFSFHGFEAWLSETKVRRARYADLRAQCTDLLSNFEAAPVRRDMGRLFVGYDGYGDPTYGNVTNVLVQERY